MCSHYALIHNNNYYTELSLSLSIKLSLFIYYGWMDLGKLNNAESCNKHSVVVYADKCTVYLFIGQDK